MLSEVLNALLLTFLATEYLLANDVATVGSRHQPDWSKCLLRPQTLVMGGAVALVNVVERLSGAALFLAAASANVGRFSMAKECTSRRGRAAATTADRTKTCCIMVG